MFKKYLPSIFIILPILVLLAASTYFGYNAWIKYQNNISFKTELENTKLLQSLEHSVLNEIVCIATMSEDKVLMQKVCDPTKKTTDALIQQLLGQDDRSLYPLEKVVSNMRNSIEDSGTIAVEKLVNGDLDKTMHVFIQNYTEKLKNNSESMDKKEYVRLYADITGISYETESEKALVSYYLSLKKPIPSENLIYWDKTVSHSQIPELNQAKISILHEDVESILKSDNFQATLRGIEDIRIDIMTHSNAGNYTSSVVSWVGLLNQKQKVLHRIENMLLDKIFDDVSRESKTNFTTLMIALGSLLLSILGLIFILSILRKNKAKKALLDDLLTKVSNLSTEEKVTHIDDDLHSYKMAYDFIGSNYESLHQKEDSISMENKSNTTFLNNLAYEVRTPMNGISGYTRLLKETPLNAEQNDFISVIENSYENLDSILSKLTIDTVVPNEKLEVENKVFDLVKKIESTVETFSIKADQKDMVLGLYIDPVLPSKVKGDGTKLAQIMTNLTHNALESSNAYSTIDISLEKVHQDNEQVTIKFSVKDEGIGYNDDELSRILDAFNTMETVENIANIDMKNLSISNKIIKRMGGKLELTSQKGEGSTFFFTLAFEKDTQENDQTVYPTFESMKVGLALPSKDIRRQVDKNLEAYIKHTHADFELYDYESLFNKESSVVLPDLLFAYHNYARLEGELEAFSSLPCKVALITSGTLRARINTDKHLFSSIVYAPMTMGKVANVLAQSKIESPKAIESSKESKESTPEVQKFENIHALVAEDNDISKKIITNILQKNGVEVTVAEDGQKAFELRRENDFNIIFMDMDMPVMDGLESTSKILYYEGVNRFDHIPIIGLVVDSENLDESLKQQYEKAGIDDFISKPIESDMIVELIQKYCIDMPRELAQTEEDELIAKVLAGDFLKE